MHLHERVARDREIEALLGWARHRPADRQLQERVARDREIEPPLGWTWAHYLSVDRSPQKGRERVREPVLEQQTAPARRAALVGRIALARQAAPERQIESLLGLAWARYRLKDR
jgi:hypothetical protein